jgi:NinB protein
MLELTLHNRAQAWAAIKAQLYPFLASSLQAGGQWVLTVKRKTRSIEQNSKLHAMFQDIANQVDWCGKKLDAHVWKRLCMAAWLREKNENPTLIPAIDGKGFDVIYEKTSKLNTTQCAELIEWCFAFGAEHGVIFRDLEDEL